LRSPIPPLPGRSRLCQKHCSKSLHDDLINGVPDRLTSGYGDDAIYGGGSRDVINGGPGDGTIISDEGNTPNQVRCGPETVYAFGSDHSNLVENRDNGENLISFRGDPL
jgi:hypothetical protein